MRAMCVFVKHCRRVRRSTTRGTLPLPCFYVVRIRHSQFRSVQTTPARISNACTALQPLWDEALSTHASTFDGVVRQRQLEVVPCISNRNTPSGSQCRATKRCDPPCQPNGTGNKREGQSEGRRDSTVRSLAPALSVWSAPHRINHTLGQDSYEVWLMFDSQLAEASDDIDATLTKGQARCLSGSGLGGHRLRLWGK